MKARQILLLAGVLLGLFSPGAARAVTNLTVTPMTWNVVGLDSNNVAVGPNDFPVGARVCNGGLASTSVTDISFVWDDGGGLYTSSVGANGYINLRDGTLSSMFSAGPPLSLAAGACFDAYFEVVVNRVPTAYDKTRSFHITATDAGGAASTPRPREIYVERLISQSRNYTDNVSYGPNSSSLTSVAAGGTMNLLVGETYVIRLDASTATQGYNQLQTFVNFPNTIFQILSVSSTYSADDPLPPAGYVPNPNGKIYADGCLWDADPASPSYRSCTGVDGKAGGTITVDYTVRILSVPGSPLVNPQPLSTLIQDFSGSSYHYNADFSAQTRFASVQSPVSISKTFSPLTVPKDTDATLSFSLTNISPSTKSSVNFADTTGWPAGLRVGSSTAVTSNGNCGSYSYTPNPLVAHSTNSISFSGISIAAGATCTLSIVVESASDGTYANTTGNLFADTADLGVKATATLNVASTPPMGSYNCVAAGGAKSALATWNFAAGDGGTATSPNYSSKAADVSTATATASGGTASIDTALTGSTSGVNSWQNAGGWLGVTTSPPPTHTTTPYYEFAANTSNYSEVEIRLSRYLGDSTSTWGNPGDNKTYVHTAADASWTDDATGTGATRVTWIAYNAGSGEGIDRVATATGANTTTFRLNQAGASKAAAATYVDDVQIVGCERPAPPTLSKAFSPLTVERDTIDAATQTTVRYTTLTFTIANPNTSASIPPLTGVNFTDTLPAGLVVANPPTVSSVACSAGSLTGATITAVAGSRTISLSGGTLSGAGTTRATGCTFSVRVQGQVAGSFTNTSGQIAANIAGPNTTGGANVGYGQASLTVAIPPTITKSFASNLIYTTAPNTSTTLTFTITNPSASNMTAVAFSDALPLGLTVATATASACGGTNNLVTTHNTSPTQDTIALSGGSISAGGTCTIAVTVTGAVAGNYTNTTGTVTATAGGVSLTGSTASDSITVKTRVYKVSLLKQSGLGPDGPWASFTTVPTPLPQLVYFRFVIENTGDSTLTTVRVNDLSLPGLDVSSCNTGTLAQGDIVVCVAGPEVVTVGGSYTNTANATSDQATSVNVTTRYGTAELLFTKSVAETSFSAAGEVLHYTYQVFNNGGTSYPGPLSVTDDKATVTCGALTSVGNLDGNLDPDEGVSCTASYTVLAADVAAGFVTNTATATINGVSKIVSKTVPLANTKDLTVTKDNNVNGAVALGSSFTWDIVASNTGTGSATFAAGQTILRDPLPSTTISYGAVTVGSFTNITNSGNVLCQIVASVLTCSANGGPVTIGATNGSFKVSFTATPTAAGTYQSTTTVDPNNNVAEINETNNASTDAVTALAFSPPTVAKSFGAASVANGGSTTLTLTLTSPVSNPAALIGVRVDDPFPAGIILESTTFTYTPGGCGTATMTDGSPSALYDTAVRLSVPSLAAGASCAVQMTVSCWTTGSLTNTTGAPTSTAPPLTGTAASAPLSVTGPTAVRLLTFAATVRGDGTDLRWRTGHEVGNLGFNVYRDDGRGRLRINADMIVGSVLLAGPRVAVTAGRSYAWRDEAAAGGGRYYLEDVDISGKRTLYGPFTPVAAADAAAPPLERSATFASLSATGRGARDQSPAPAAAGLPLPDAAAAPLAGVGAVDIDSHRSPEQAQRILAASPAVKIAVRETGWYRITQAELAGFGLDQVDPQFLQLYADGRQIPMAVSSAAQGSPAAPQFSVEFYGRGLDEPLTDTRSYWLVRARKKGLRIPTTVAARRTAAPPDFPSSVVSRPRQYYIPALPKNLEGDRFFGPYVYTDPLALDLTVGNPAAAPGAIAVLDVTLQGILDGEHVVDVVLNDTKIGQVLFSRMERGQAALQFSQSLLREGTNQVELTARGGENDFSFVDVVRLSYWHAYAADNDLLRFTAPGGARVAVSGFSAPDIRVMDVTDPDAVSEVSVQVAAQGAGYAATFTVPRQGPRTLYSFTGTGMLHPSAMAANSPSSWRGRGNKADVAMIAHASLLPALAPLKHYREAQGHAVALVDVEDLYDEFSYGNKTPAAIRAFLQHTNAAWARAPKFVLLAGSATYDPRHYLDGLAGFDGPADLVPTNIVDGFYAEAASDDMFADFDDDGLPEMGVGRIPAGAAAAVTATVSKVMRYEKAAPGTWTRKATVVADSDPGQFNFERDSDEIASLLEPAMAGGVERLYRGNGAGAPAVLDSLNRGALLVNYVGHGSEDFWGGNGFFLFGSSDAAALTNGLKLPFFLDMDCWNGSFPNLYTTSLGEALLSNKDGGAVAVWASSGLTEPAPQHEINTEMIRLLFNGSHLTLGEAAARAKAATSDMDVRRTWILFGDPMTRLKQ